MTALLAFDTSGERINVGIAVDDAVLVADEAGGAQASAKLIPCARRLLGEAGIGLHELDAIAFGRGPGAFTGLRAACSAAQGLAWGAALPVLAIDTLQAVAEDARTRVGADYVWVAMDARMGEVFAGRYRWSDAGWTTLDAPALATPDELNALFALRPSRWIVGSAPGAIGASLRWHPQTRIDPDAKPSGHALLVCARAAWARGDRLDPGAALPLYLRNKVAFTTAERVAAAHNVA